MTIRSSKIENLPIFLQLKYTSIREDCKFTINILKTLAGLLVNSRGLA